MIGERLRKDFKFACESLGGEISFERNDELVCDVGIRKIEDEGFVITGTVHLILEDFGEGRQRFVVDTDNVTFGVEGKIDFVSDPGTLRKERLGKTIARSFAKGRSSELIRDEIDKIVRDMRYYPGLVPVTSSAQVAELKKILKEREKEGSS